MKMRKEGQPQGARQLKDVLKISNAVPRPYSLPEVLVFLLSTNMTKAAYHECRTAALECNHDLYPPYNDVRKEK